MTNADRGQMALALFARQETITASDVARALGLSSRMARLLRQEWVAAGWLLLKNAANRSRAWVIGKTSAICRQWDNGIKINAFPRCYPRPRAVATMKWRI